MFTVQRSGVSALLAFLSVPFEVFRPWCTQQILLGLFIGYYISTAFVFAIMESPKGKASWEKSSSSSAKRVASKKGKPLNSQACSIVDVVEYFDGIKENNGHEGFRVQQSVQGL